MSITNPDILVPYGISGGLGQFPAAQVPISRNGGSFVADGEVLIAQFQWDSAVANADSLAAPPGWTKLDSSISGVHQTAVFTHVASGEPNPVYTFVWPVPIAWNAAEIYRFRGATGIGAVAAIDGLTAQSVNLPTPNSAVLCLYTASSTVGDQVIVLPSGLTAIVGIFHTSQSTYNIRAAGIAQRAQIGPTPMFTAQVGFVVHPPLAASRAVTIALVAPVPQIVCPSVDTPVVTYGSFTRTGPNNPAWALTFHCVDTSLSATLGVQLRTQPNRSGTLVASGTVSLSNGVATGLLSVAYNAPGVVNGFNNLFLTVNNSQCVSPDLLLAVRRDDFLFPVNQAIQAAVGPAGPAKHYALFATLADDLSFDQLELYWRLRTGPNGSGVLVLDGHATSGAPFSTDVYDPGLVQGANARYLRLRDGANNIVERAITVTADLTTASPPSVSGLGLTRQPCGPYMSSYATPWGLSFFTSNPNGGTLSASVVDQFGDTVWTGVVAANSTTLAQIPFIQRDAGIVTSVSYTITVTNAAGLSGSAGFSIPFDDDTVNLSGQAVGCDQFGTWTVGGLFASPLPNGRVGDLAAWSAWTGSRVDSHGRTVGAGTRLAQGSVVAGQVSAIAVHDSTIPVGTTTRFLEIDSAGCVPITYALAISRPSVEFIVLSYSQTPQVTYEQHVPYPATRLGPNSETADLWATVNMDLAHRIVWEVWTGPGRTGSQVNRGAFGAGTYAAPVSVGPSVVGNPYPVNDFNAATGFTVPEGTNVFYLVVFDFDSGFVSNSLPFVVFDDKVAAPIGSSASVRQSPVSEATLDYDMDIVLTDDLSTVLLELHWEVRDGAGGTGHRIAFGDTTSGLPFVLSVFGDRTFLQPGVNTRYLRWYDGALNPAELVFYVSRQLPDLAPTVISAAVSYACGDRCGPRSTPFAIDVAASDPEGGPVVAEVRTSINGGGTLVASGAPGSLSVPWDQFGMHDGDNVLYVTALDPAGNRSTDAFVVVSRDPTTVPNWYDVKVSDVVAGAYTVTMALIDDFSVLPFELTWSWEVPDGGQVLQSGTETNGNFFSFGVSDPTLGSGLNDRLLRMTDGACNEATALISVQGAPPAPIQVPPRPCSLSIIHDGIGAAVDDWSGLTRDQTGGLEQPIITLCDRVPSGKYAIVRRNRSLADVAASLKGRGLRGAFFRLSPPDFPNSSVPFVDPRSSVPGDPDWAAWQRVLRLDQLVGDPGPGQLAGPQTLRAERLVVGGFFELGQTAYDNPAAAAYGIAGLRNELNLDAVIVDATDPSWAGPRSGEKLLALCSVAQTSFVRSPSAPDAPYTLSTHCPLFVCLPASQDGYGSLLSADGVIEAFANGFTGPKVLGMARVEAGRAFDAAASRQWARPWSREGKGIGQVELLVDVRSRGDPTAAVNAFAAPQAVSFSGLPGVWDMRSGLIVYDDLDAVDADGCPGTDPTGYWGYDGLHPHHGTLVPVVHSDPPPQAAIGRDYGVGGTSSCSDPYSATLDSISMNEALQRAAAAGFSGQDQVTTIAAIAIAESGLRTLATNANTDGSVDRGILQINSIHDGEGCGSDCGFGLVDILDPWRFGLALFKRRGDFSDWVTYNNGLHLPFMALALACFTGQSIQSAPLPGSAGGANRSLKVSFESWRAPFDRPTAFRADDPACPDTREIAGSWITLNGAPIAATPHSAGLLTGALYVGGRPQSGDVGFHPLLITATSSQADDHLSTSVSLGATVFDPGEYVKTVAQTESAVARASWLHPPLHDPAAAGRLPDYWISAADYCASTSPFKHISARQVAGARSFAPSGTLVGCPCAAGFPLTSDCSWHVAHEGIQAVDIGVPSGSALFSACDGRIAFRGFDPRYDPSCTATLFGQTVGCGYGYTVEVDCGGGKTLRYGHMSPGSVFEGPSVGDPVAAGQRLGTSDDTGYSSGPHLHFEVRQDGLTLCPLAFLPDGCLG